MDFWQRARSFAEEAAKRSQELTNGISPSTLSDVVSEASKRSKEIAAEASKKSKEIAAEALKRAEEIKSQLPPAAVALSLSNLVDTSSPTSAPAVSEADLEKFGVTDELREFVKGITLNTFRDFPLEDDSEMSDIPAVSNVRQDLTEWQEKHAKLVLLTVKEIKKLRYELCPRVMKERKFWRIYFILVNSHVEPFEKRYAEEEKQKTAEKLQEGVAKEVSSAGTTSAAAVGGANQKSKNATSEQDLDVFLLGDTGDSDEGPDDGDDGFDDDFDKI